MTLLQEIHQRALERGLRALADLVRVNHLDDGGRVAVGALADLVVLDRDLTTVPDEEVSAARVDLTLVDGRPVYVR